MFRSRSPTHTPTEWLLLCPLTQTFPQKRGRKPFTPFYLLSSHPPICAPRGCIGAEKGIPPHFPPLCLFLPLISHNCADTQIGTLAHIQTKLTRSTAVHKVTNWGLCLLKGGGEPRRSAHTEASSSIVGRFPCMADNARCSRRWRGEIWCCLCGR